MKKIIPLLLIIINFHTSAQEVEQPFPKMLRDSISVDTSVAVIQNDSLNVLPAKNVPLRDSLKSKFKPVVFIPYSHSGLSSYYITEKQKASSDYRYTGNILSLLPFSFLQDLGSIGQPNELTVYGLGNGNMAFTNNGVNLNNRWQNSSDAFFVQSEFLDSIEQIPLTSGFLYNTLNNPVHVNYISKSGISKQAYSRMRFYQAPSDEGYLNVIFNAPILRSTYFYFELSNIAGDPRGGKQTGTTATDFNTDFSLWNLNTGLRYFLNSSWNIFATYRNANKNTELNGGAINNSEMYDPINADVVYPYRFERTTKHEFSLSINADLFEGFITNITGYYNYNRQDFKQNKDSISSDIPSIIHNNNYKTYGFSGRQFFLHGIFDFDLLVNYEHSDYTTELFGNDTEDILSVASKVKLNLFDSFFPSLFAKTFNYRKVQYNGFGAEGIIRLSNNFRLFGGVSFIEKPFSILENIYLSPSVNVNKQKLNAIELRSEYVSRLIRGSLAYFYITNDNAAVGIIEKANDSIVVNEISSFETKSLQRSGVNLSFDLKIWKLEFINNLSYYLDHASNKYNSVPQYSLQGGVYYIDTLFNQNLYLKAGVNYKLTGEKSFVTYDFEKALPAFYFSGNNVSDISQYGNVAPTQQLDVFISGTIQKKAIVYIVFENVLDTNYYLVPYYPMYPQGLRLGVAWEFLD